MAYESLDDFTKEQGLAKKTPLDPEILKKIAENQKAASQPLTGGISESLGFGKTNPMQFASALGGPVDTTKSIVDAVQSRGRQRSQDYISNLKRNVELMNPVREAQAAKQAGANYAAATDIDLSNYKIQKQNELDKRRIGLYKQQRADSILGGILGVLGTVGGAILGGVPGALVGGAVGGAAGGKK